MNRVAVRGTGQPLLLAIDAGGTSTRAMVLTPDGTGLGVGVAGSGNPVSAGPDRAGAAIREAVRTALERSGRPAAEVELAQVAMAGSGGRSSWVSDQLAAIGIASPVEVSGDLIATFCSGTHLLDGVGAVAGTGAAAIRVEQGAVARVVDGRGWLLGDVGSGFWLAHAAIRAVVADLDGRAPATGLTPRLLAETGYTGPPPREPVGAAGALDHLVAVAYAMAPVAISKFAPLVFEVDDPTAADIAERAAEGLTRTILTAADGRLSQPLVLGGGVLHRQPAMAARVRAHLRQAGWTGPVQPVPDGLAGAAVLVLRGAGVAVDQRMAARVRASLREHQTA